MLVTVTWSLASTLLREFLRRKVNRIIWETEQ